MQQLAAAIRRHAESLVDQYDARLGTMAGYSRLPETTRRELERHVLDLIALCLEVADSNALVQYVQKRASQWVAMGLDLAWFQQALIIPEDILVPLIDSAEASTFLWRALNRSQSAVWQMVAERAHEAEQALRQSQQLLQMVMDNIPQAIFWKDKDLVYLGCNRAFAADAGLTSPSDVIGKTDWDMPWKEQAELYRADDSLVMESGAPKLDYAEPQTTPDGSTNWLRTSKVPMRDTIGNVTAVLGVYEDITERKRAEEALQESEAKYSAVVTQASDGVVIIQDNTIRFANPALASILGYATPEEIENTPFVRYIAPESVALVAERVKARLAGKDVPAVYEAKLRRKDGSAFDAELSAGVVQYFGKPADLGLIRDITERKQLEQQIRESLERRGRQVQTSIQVSQEIATAPDLNELFRRVVTLIKEHFNYYHAQFFRYEPSLEAVALVTGYGEVGQHMLAKGHKLPMGRGVVGTAAASGESILAADVTQDEDWRPNPYLPDTKGELAVPVKFRDQVLGILDVQSDQVGALTEDDRLLLEGLCGQIASAMESTRLLERLRRSEAQLSEALKIAKLAYWEYDVEKDLFLFNDQFYSLFHTTAEQHGGYQLSSAYYAQHFVHPDDLAIVGTEIEKALNSTDRHYNRQLEHRILYADGGVGYISVSVNIDRDEQGHLVRYYGANQDITESKLAEQTIREEQQRSQAILETATVPMIVSRLSDSKVLYANQALAQIGHISLDELIGGRTVDFFVNRDDRDKVVEILQWQGYVSDFETQLRRGDGVPYWVLLSARIINFQNETCVLSAYVDITDRKQAEVEREQLLVQQQKRALQLQTAAEVSRAASSILSLDELLPQAVELVRARFNLYYVGIFLVDESGQWAVLQAGTGEAGRQMLAAGHRLKVGGSSMISWCIVNRQARIVLDVGEEASRFDNPLLPLTRSEVALPLTSRGSVIGAVTIQTDQPAAFTAEDIAALQTMADQLANTIENARLFEQTQTINRQVEARLQEMEILNRLAREVSSTLDLDHVLDTLMDVLSDEMKFTHIVLALIDWTAGTLHTIRAAGTAKGMQGLLRPLDQVKNDIVMDIARKGQVEVIDGWDTRFDREIFEREGHAALVRSFVPLMLRGESIGVLEVGYNRTERAVITEHEVRLLHGLADQTAIAVHNTRLFEQTQRALAERDAVNRRLTGEAWESYLHYRSRENVIWASDDEKIAPAPLLTADESLATGQIIIEPAGDRQRATLTAPIMLRGQPIGALRVQAPQGSWNEEMQNILSSIAGHVAQAAENARLLEESEERFARERALADATNKIRRRSDVERILQTAAEELARHLGAARVAVQVGATAPAEIGDSRAEGEHVSSPSTAG